MKIKGWKYYNYAVIPTTPPHEIADMTDVKNGHIWKIGGGIPLFARWTSDFDCEQETDWWYVIKDTPFDINVLKAKRRYEINKGKKNFNVKIINPTDYIDKLYEITVAAYSQWPEKYRPQVNESDFKEEVKRWKCIVFGAFDMKNDFLNGYALLTETKHHSEFQVLRVRPEAERKGVNAAMVAGILEYYNDRLGKAFYINDGSRSIRHETAFQDYLEKYFGFRKAYCKLNIKYRFPFGFCIKILYPFRNKINKGSRLGSLISGVLQMEEIQRNCK